MISYDKKHKPEESQPTSTRPRSRAACFPCTRAILQNEAGNHSRRASICWMARQVVPVAGRWSSRERTNVKDGQPAPASILPTYAI